MSTSSTQFDWLSIVVVVVVVVVVVRTWTDGVLVE